MIQQYSAVKQRKTTNDNAWKLSAVILGTTTCITAIQAHDPNHEASTSIITMIINYNMHAWYVFIYLYIYTHIYIYIYK